jgi:hypothetical protein
MSVVVWKDGVLAGDKMADDNGFRSKSTKVFKTDKFLFGSVGDSAAGTRVMQWFTKGGAKPVIGDETPFRAIYVRKEKDGSVSPFFLENSLVLDPIEDEFYAIGSGAHFALMAMHLGRSAESAVMLTIDLCTSCGFGVDSVTFNQP